MPPIWSACALSFSKQSVWCWWLGPMATSAEWGTRFTPGKCAFKPLGAWHAKTECMKSLNQFACQQESWDYLEGTNYGNGIPSILKHAVIALTPFSWLMSSATFSRMACIAISFGGGLWELGMLNCLFSLCKHDFLVWISCEYSNESYQLTQWPVLTQHAVLSNILQL